MTSVATIRPVIDCANAMAAVELLPIPAAVVGWAGEALSLMAVNRAFQLAGLGNARDASPLLTSIEPDIAAFLASEATTRTFAWSIGEAIDRRFFSATLARSSPGVRGCLVTLIDETSHRHTERSLHREMTTDSLTGLPNRQGFGDLIETAGSDRAGHAVLVVDLDRFGRFNACLGSLSGDELLISVARRIKGALRARDTLARIGGDEFGIFMAIDEDRAEAEHVAKRIRLALTAPFRLSDYEIRVDCSIGIAFGADEQDNASDGDNRGDGGEELIRHAQFAVNRAKATGKAEAYQTQAFDLVREQFAIETQLRRAIENGDLRLNFQPICDLSTGRITCFEALARWRTADGRNISPAQFIEVAEESGLIVPLGRWALDAATRTLAEWDREAGGDCGVQIAVNISPIQLQRDGVVGLVGDALARTGLSGNRLKLELTESALVADPDRTARTMRALKDLGTTLAMDDFGTGYSNLAHLQALPIDILKIDRSFVTGMLADRDKIAIVRAVLSLAQALNMRTVAEGIETNALAQTLSALGCNMGQGFLYARPLEPGLAYAMIAPPSA
ncbi:putative bifunctional diguanylate cyclase/phosphodiesterase [Sphingomonas sp.]|uniref:putative bifunctional diguanylate cyclase/phosphodiesterase n=1 Tax=Sphingomonas sp. TaxID=28214 RepID=UPI0035BBA16F